MLKKTLIIVLICAVEAAVLAALWPRPAAGPDAPSLNALLRSAELSGGNYDSIDADGYDFTIVSRDGRLLFASAPDLPHDPLTAAVSGSIVLPMQDGILIAAPDETETESSDPFQLVLIIIAVSGAGMFIYTLWIDRRIVRPFRGLRRTAEAIAAGNFNFPLAMDRGGIFGPFTESFDMMRHELARSQAAEKRAAQARQDLIAKLSHDLRTPVASIQAVSELGAFTAGEADRQRFSQIAGKAVQLSVLISNLLNAALEEQTGFTVTARRISSAELEELLAGADYEHWLLDLRMPSCAVYADPVRLQQVFDNILSNAYKYGRSPVTAAGFIQNGEFLLEIEDAGGGVSLDEVGRLALHSFRGRNAQDAPGAGLGLYICRQLLEAMDGELLIRNGSCGLEVTVILPLSRKCEPAGLRKS